MRFVRCEREPSNVVVFLRKEKKRKETLHSITSIGTGYGISKKKKREKKRCLIVLNTA